MNTSQMCLFRKSEEGPRSRTLLAHYTDIVTRQRYAAALIPASITLGST
jgi:hypothetical protein